MVSALEANYDAEANAAAPTTVLPSGEQLAAEIERYLRDQG